MPSHSHVEMADDMVHIIGEPCDIMSGMCNACMHAWSVCPIKTSASKLSSGLACMQANSNLAKITTSHFWVLNIQNAN